MASLTIVYWRDIPAQVIVKKGRETAKVQLTERFEKAIDRAAMRANLRDTDSYLAEWRRAAAVDVSDDLQVEADKAAAALEAAYPDDRLKVLVEAGGTDAAKTEG
ncbi:MAG TPA: virulence factor [Terriglobia bacterium]|nr:virulence factor [Terriglobia bacterium]